MSNLKTFRIKLSIPDHNYEGGCFISLRLICTFDDVRLIVKVYTMFPTQLSSKFAVAQTFLDPKVAIRCRKSFILTKVPINLSGMKHNQGQPSGLN